jgi:prephenate dehydrogenase
MGPAKSNKLLTDISSVKSTVCHFTPDQIFAAAALSLESERLAINTSAPAWADAVAIASPIPELPPITNTFGSFSLIVFSLNFFSN